MNSYLAREKIKLSESNDFLYGVHSIMLGGHVKRTTARILESYVFDAKRAYYAQTPYTMTKYAVY